ncbi:MAG: Na+/H+ antiporter NhaC family protein [Myxococcota bacterium]
MGTIMVVIYAQGVPAGTGVLGVFSLGVWRQAFIVTGGMLDGNFLSYLFAVASLLGSLVAICMTIIQKIATPAEAIGVWFQGARSMAIAFGILLMAWALSAACKDLQTAAYVGAALHGISAAAVPLVVFLVSGVVAFATGTSWGTMAILIPTAAAVGYNAGGEAVMLISMAAVLDGAIFGDHCSPISDTTVMSSICSSCDHLDHVKTQAPYALLGALVAGGCGYGLVAAAGLPLWVGYGTGFVLLWGVLRVFGRVAQDASPTEVHPIVTLQSESAS